MAAATNIKQYKAELNEQVSKEIMAIRVPHTKATSEAAMKIAEHISGINKFDLHAACVFHDIAKELPYETMVKIIISARGNPLLDEVIGDIDIAEYESTKWLHGIVGAIVAHKCYHIDSKDVLKAIRYHKVGNIHDSTFTKILITADVANELRQARHMVTAYTILKMQRFNMEKLYPDIVKHDTFVAITMEDVVIPRMLEGTTFAENMVSKCPLIGRLGQYYSEDAEYIWMPNKIDGKWQRVSVDGIYVTPNDFGNARVVMDNIRHHFSNGVMLTLSDHDRDSYMLSTITPDNEANQHVILPFKEAHNSGLTLPRGFYPKRPTRYYAIDGGSL